MTSFTNVFTGSTIYPSEIALTQLAMTADVELYWPVEAPDGEPTAAEIVEITSTTGSWSIILPDATQVSVGQTILFNKDMEIVIYSDDEREFISCDWKTGNQADMKYCRDAYRAKTFKSLGEAKEWEAQHLGFEGVTFLQIMREK